MPIYEYQCPQCHAVFEEWLKVSDAGEKNTAPCPHCDAVSPHIISNTAFVLKGGGWYVTEYGNKKSASQDAASVATQGADKGSEKGAENVSEKAPEKQSVAHAETRAGENVSAATSSGAKTPSTSDGVTKNTACERAAAS